MRSIEDVGAASICIYTAFIFASRRRCSRQKFYPRQPLGPVGAGPRRGARDAGDFRSPVLHSSVSRKRKIATLPPVFHVPKVCSTRVRVVFSAKLQRYPIFALFCSTGARPKLQRYPLFRASSRVRRGEPNGTTISLGVLIVVSEDPEVLLSHTPRSSSSRKSTPPKTPPK